VRLRRWEDEADPPAPIVSLEDYRRHLRAVERRAVHNEGVTIGFFEGLGAAVLLWAIFSGSLASLAYKLVTAAAYVLSQAGR
jgi:hypothetical protein